MKKGPQTLSFILKKKEEILEHVLKKKNITSIVLQKQKEERNPPALSLKSKK
jgi:hypothetical protein